MFLKGTLETKKASLIFHDKIYVVWNVMVLYYVVINLIS